MTPLAQRAADAHPVATPAIRLLLIDDEEPNRDMLSRRLRRHGYEVEVAASAVQGHAALQRRAFDAVLLDVHMPGVSGLDMLRALRLQYSQIQLPIIMVTAKRESADIVEALDLGANDYITKPVDLPVALARIRTQVGRKQAEQALADSEERYALAVRGSRDGLWDWRIEAGEVFYSPRWNDVLGYDAAEAVGDLDRWFSRVHADDLVRVRAELDDHLEGRTASFESEHRVRHGAGQYRWVLARGTAVRDAAGRPIRMAGSFTDITEGKVADALTGLPNRALFMDRLTRLVEHRLRHGHPDFAVMFVDLDRFKNVNDTLGHQAGDRLLLQVARRLEQGLRGGDSLLRARDGGAPAALPGDTLARMGGDEFAILLSGVRDERAAMEVAARLADRLAEPVSLGGQDVFTSASIGIALAATSAGDATGMLRDADTALYRAKAAGRTRAVVFDQAMREEVLQRTRREGEIRRAIDRQEFVVHYQPIVSVSRGQVAGLEALVRWRHPDQGLLDAREFVPLAEETGLIVPLGYRVFEEVCRQLGAWTARDAAWPPLAVAVNMSALQLAQSDLPDRLAAVAAQHGVPPEAIEIEIPESVVTANLGQVQPVIERLKVRGFRLSIDRFGAGHSSFTYLQRFQVDRLKIDRSFLSADADASPIARGLLGAVVELARRLKVDVVAQGVETREQLEHLQRIDCALGQGFAFLEPMAPEQLADLLRARAAGAEDAPPVPAGPDDGPGACAGPGPVPPP